MKKIIFYQLVFSIVIGENNSYSQPVLEKADILPKIGDFIPYQLQNVLAPITHIKGENVTWDFTYDPNSTKTKFIVIKDPANTPFDTVFPGADYCELSYVQAPTYATYSYLEVKDDTIEEKGSVFSLPTCAAFSYYDDPHELVQFPVHYGDSIVYLYRGHDINCSNEVSTGHGHREYKVDGYGTLAYSTGDTMREVVQISVFDYYVDSTLTTYDSNYDHTISWYKAGIHTPLIVQNSGGLWSYNFVDQFITGFGGAYYIYLDPEYIIDLLTATEQSGSVDVPNVAVFPNPTRDGNFMITGPAIIQEVKILNETGSILYKSQPNTSTISLHVDHPGLYFIQMTCDDQTVVKKVIRN